MAGRPPGEFQLLQAKHRLQQHRHDRLKDLKAALSRGEIGEIEAFDCETGHYRMFFVGPLGRVEALEYFYVLAIMNRRLCCTMYHEKELVRRLPRKQLVGVVVDKGGAPVSALR